VELNHWRSRGNYRMPATRPQDLALQIQRVDHDSRVHLDIETDGIPGEMARRQRRGALRRGNATEWD